MMRGEPGLLLAREPGQGTRHLSGTLPRWPCFQVHSGLLSTRLSLCTSSSTVPAPLSDRHQTLAAAGIRSSQRPASERGPPEGPRADAHVAVPLRLAGRRVAPRPLQQRLDQARHALLGALHHLDLRAQGARLCIILTRVGVGQDQGRTRTSLSTLTRPAIGPPPALCSNLDAHPLSLPGQSFSGRSAGP